MKTDIFILVAYASSGEVPGLVRPISTTAPLQFNNNNSVHVVNPSLPAYTLPSDYGLNLSSKIADSKSNDVKDSAKRNSEEDLTAARQNSANSGDIVKLIVCFKHAIVMQFQIRSLS